MGSGSNYYAGGIGGMPKIGSMGSGIGGGIAGGIGSLNSGIAGGIGSDPYNSAYQEQYPSFFVNRLWIQVVKM